MAWDVQSISTVVFLVLLTLLLVWKRHKLQTHGPFPLFYFCMYRTKFGLAFMDFIGRRFSGTMKWLGYAGIIVGFLGMILIGYALIDNLVNLFVTEEAAPGVGLVLPIKAKGVFYVPFFYWVISIFIIAIVHEYAHGVVARAHNIKVKSSGFAFLGVLVPIIPAAFVEPDEKVVRKRPYRQQLSVFAAGPFSNILLAFLLLGISAFALSPVVDSMVEYDGVQITDFIGGEAKYPAELAGIEKNEIVKRVDKVDIRTLDNFTAALATKDPGDTVKITTNSSAYTVTLGKDPENGNTSYLGVYVKQSSRISESFEDKYGTFIPQVIIWIIGLVQWLIILNLGIGLFNLVPIGPIDGGRMMQLVCVRLLGDGQGNRTWHFISLLFLLIVLVNIGFAFFA